MPQREEFYKEQGNTVSVEGNVCNYKLLINMPIFYLITPINSSKASIASKVFSVVGNEARFVHYDQSIRRFLQVPLVTRIFLPRGT